MMRLFVTLAVALLSASVQALPQTEGWTTANGAKVLFVATHELPMIDIRIVFDAGSARDAGQSGLASLTNAMLDQGAAGLNADAIATGFDERGAQLGNGLDRDTSWLALRSLSDKALLDPSLALFDKVLQAPDFPAADFERMQQNTLTGIDYEKQKPDAIASKAFYHLIYADHPYASDPSGTKDSVAALKVDDLKTFYRRYYVAANATLVIVGDVTRTQAEAIAEQLTGALPRGEKAAPLPAVRLHNAGKTEFIAFPSSQSHVLTGEPGVRRGDADYFTLYVGNHILGGSGLVSRISNEIREKRGLSYSAYSYFIPLKRKGPYMLGFQTRNDQRDEALSVLRDTVKAYVKDGPTQTELEAAKNNIVGGFPLRVASNSNITEYLAMIGFYDLPLDYLATFTSKIKAVTVDQIRDAYQRRVNVDAMVTIILGGKVSAEPAPGAK